MPLLESQNNTPGARTIAGGTIGATIGMQGSNAIKELMKEKGTYLGKKFKGKPYQRALAGAGITAGSFLGGLYGGSKLEDRHRRNREAQTLLKQSSFDKSDAIGGTAGAVKGLASAKLYSLYKHRQASKKSLAAMALIGAGSGVTASKTVKKLHKVFHGRND